MEQKTLYTAIGRLERETNGCGRSCPVIRLGGQPYMVDMQELVVWTALNWRISKWVLASGDNRHSGSGEKRQFWSTENSHLQFE